MNASSQNQLFSHQHLTVIEPPKPWCFLDLEELWAYRELFWVLVSKEIKVRYKQTVLGSAWAVLQPFMMMLIFSLIFGRFAKIPSDGYPYPIFVFSALLPWTFFANALSSSGGSLIGASALVSKVYFPRLLVPAASVASGLVDFAVASVVLLGMMLFYGVGWTIQLLAVPLPLLGLVLTALGVGSWLAGITVVYRDFRFVVPFLVQFWMFATPVIYPTTLVPENCQWLLRLNPMTGIIDAFRSAFLGKPFDLLTLGTSMIVAGLLFALGVAYFGRIERRLADII
jgi:homopolymeric O-antigen transport system permease protein